MLSTSKRPRIQTPPQDPERALVLDRAKELGVSFFALSERLRLNAAYVHQFVHRGTPRRLSDDVRRRLAGILGVDPAELLPREEREDASARASRRAARADGAGDAREPEMAHAGAVPPPLPQSPQRHAAERPAVATAADGLPEYRDDGDLPEDAGRGPGAEVPAAARRVAFWLSVNLPRGGRLRPGDRALVATETTPPRVHDQVVVLRDRRVAAIGELEAVTREGYCVATDEDPPSAYGRDECRVLKIVQVTFD